MAAELREGSSAQDADAVARLDVHSPLFFLSDTNATEVS